MSERKTITIDIEAMEPKLRDYQKLMLDKITRGFSAGEMPILSSGRQSGKSYIQTYYQETLKRRMKSPPYELIKTATVDGEPWYVVRCNNDSASWIRAQNKRSWYEHTHAAKWQGLYSTFDINEKLFIMLKVGFSV